jgi:hypothetical protein
MLGSSPSGNPGSQNIKEVKMSTLPIIDTVGIEVEFGTVPMELVSANKPRGWQVVRDGSCTREVTLLDNIPVILDDRDEDLLNMVRRSYLGGELVSNPYNLEIEKEKFVNDSMRMLNFLAENGEKILDSTSIHVHVHLGTPPVRVLKNLTRLWCALEAPIYRMSVADQKVHRGTIHQDYMYCRPITGLGPQIVRDTDGYFRRCFDLEKILKYAKTFDEFMAAWGRADYTPNNKWWPFRYYGFNPGSCATSRRTVEFRTLNQTLRPNYLLAFVELCQAMVKSAYLGVPDLTPFPLGEEKVWEFDDIFEVVNPPLISDHSWTVLEEMFSRNTWQPGCNWQMNHLNKSIPLNELSSDLRPDRLSEEEVKRFLGREEQPREAVLRTEDQMPQPSAPRMVNSSSAITSWRDAPPTNTSAWVDFVTQLPDFEETEEEDNV